jgi:hypothetical protein
MNCVDLERMIEMQQELQNLESVLPSYLDHLTKKTTMLHPLLVQQLHPPFKLNNVGRTSETQQEPHSLGIIMDVRTS